MVHVGRFARDWRYQLVVGLIAAALAAIVAMIMWPKDPWLPKHETEYSNRNGDATQDHQCAADVLKRLYPPKRRIEKAAECSQKAEDRRIQVAAARQAAFGTRAAEQGDILSAVTSRAAILQDVLIAWTLVASIFAAIAAFRAARAADETLRDNREAGEREQRAYIMVDEANFQDPDNPRAKRLMLRMRNYGATPARKGRMTIQYFMVSTDIVQRGPPEWSREETHEFGLCAPGAPVTLLTTFSNSEGFWENLAAQGAAARIRGTVSYADAFDQLRQTHFYMACPFGAITQFAYMPEGNDYT